MAQLKITFESPDPQNPACMGVNSASFINTPDGKRLAGDVQPGDSILILGPGSVPVVVLTVEEV